MLRIVVNKSFLAIQKEQNMEIKNEKISTIVEKIESNRIYLPAIQRKYVWKDSQITKLMDSIMRGYPIGTFLFWKVKKETLNSKKYSMYKFIKDYHERDRYKNDPAPKVFNIDDSDPDSSIYSALDGQQRLTSLYISLFGSISRRLPRKRSKNDNAYPKKELYFNLLSEAKDDEEDIIYDFEFLTAAEANAPESEKIWFRVKDILGFGDLSSLNKHIRANGWEEELVYDNLTLLFERIKNERNINYFEVESENIDDVLDIFVRVNSGGTVLYKTDLLFSTIVSYWDGARDEIDNFLSEINSIGEKYSFTTDFIMKSCLYFMDLDISLKVESFGKSNVDAIKDKWEDIKAAIKDTIILFSSLGFSKENLIADNVVEPIAYYRFKYGNEAFKDDINPATKQVQFDVKMEIRKFIIVTQLKRIFAQSTNNTLTSMREELKKHSDKFRFSYLQDLQFVGGERTLRFDEETIKNWMSDNEKGPYTFMLLSVLYPNLKFDQKDFHQDHMHPYSSFEKKNETALKSMALPSGEPVTDAKIELWRHQRNTIANLQMLEGRENESKNDTPLIQWLQVPANRDNVKYLPQGISYELANFDQFFEKRYELMLEQLKRVLLD